MDAKDRIIFPLDVSNVDEARRLVDQLYDYVGSFKIGLEFINNLLTDLLISDSVRASSLLTQARNLFSNVVAKLFWDGKLKDIPATIAGAASGTSRLGVRMFNVHCDGGEDMMKAARQAAEQYAQEHQCRRPLVLGVTVLTSLDAAAFRKMGIHCPADDLAMLVVTLAGLAKGCGLDGVICSPHELMYLRSCDYLYGLHYVIPGVRPEWAQVDDQKRVMTPAEAIKAGATELVIGRPIRKPPTEIGSPIEAAKRIADEIAAAL